MEDQPFIAKEQDNLFKTYMLNKEYLEQVNSFSFSHHLMHQSQTTETLFPVVELKKNLSFLCLIMIFQSKYYKSGHLSDQ